MSNARDPLPIRSVLDDQAKRLGLGDPRHVGSLFGSWTRIVGPAIAAHVEPGSLRDGRLKVWADSPAWATEIGYLREDIRGRVNAALGAEVVRRIEVAVRPLVRPPVDPIRGEQAAEQGERADEPTTRRRRSDDPVAAFRRARAAWVRRRSRGR